MKLNEEEMYNAHLWLLTVSRVGISFYLPHSQTFSLKFLASFRRSDNLQSWRYNFFRYGFTNP